MADLFADLSAIFLPPSVFLGQKRDNLVGNVFVENDFI